MQDAFATALERWPRDGVPRDPGRVDRRRRAQPRDRPRPARARAARPPPGARGARAEPTSRDAEHAVPTSVPDERLRLIFTCCHPALAREAQVALTLRLLGGLTTAEIAHAFLVAEPTMAQRLAARRRRSAPRRSRSGSRRDAALPARLEAVLDVIYLDLQRGLRGERAATRSIRRSLCAEALRLAAIVAVPDARPARGARPARAAARPRGARATPASTRTASSSCSRTRTARAGTARRSTQATRLAARALRLGPPGRYVLQAAIAVEHANAPTLRTNPLGPHRRATTATSPRSPPTRSWSSTGPWRSRWPATSTAAWRGSTRSRRRSTATTTSTPPAPTCCAGRRATRPRAAYARALELAGNAAERALPAAPPRVAARRSPRSAAGRAVSASPSRSAGGRSCRCGLRLTRPISRVSRGPLRGGLRPVLTHSRLTPTTRSGDGPVMTGWRRCALTR